MALFIPINLMILNLYFLFLDSDFIGLLDVESILMCLSFLLVKKLVEIHWLQSIKTELVDLPHDLVDEVCWILRVGYQSKLKVTSYFVLAWSLSSFIVLSLSGVSFSFDLRQLLDFYQIRAAIGRTLLPPVVLCLALQEPVFVAVFNLGLIISDSPHQLIQSPLLAVDSLSFRQHQGLNQSLGALCCKPKELSISCVNKLEASIHKIIIVSWKLLSIGVKPKFPFEF